ncbi:hypothetical protein PAGL106935_13990 [Paenibacillus glucanolyticus]
MVGLRHMNWYVKIWLISLLLLPVCSSTAAASWAYSFVVNDGKIYVMSEDRVEASTLGDVVGKVTYYSDREGTYSGNFSNAYPKGTQYYAVKGIATEKAIAVETTEGYLLAQYEGEYGGGAHTPWQAIKNWIAAGLILLIVVCVAVVVRKKMKDGSYRH